MTEPTTELFKNNRFKANYLVSSIHAMKHTADNDVAEFLTIMNIMCWNVFVETMHKIPSAINSVSLMTESESEELDKAMVEYRESFITYLKNKHPQESIITKLFVGNGKNRDGSPLTEEGFFDILRSNEYDELLSCLQSIAPVMNTVSSLYFRMTENVIDNLVEYSKTDNYPRA